MKRKWPRWRLTFEALPPRLREGMAQPIPDAIRVRQLLKYAGRAQNLKCVLVERLPDAGEESKGGTP
jgi:hypothetical protein